MEGYHSSVLLKEAVDALIPARLRQDGLATAGRDVWYLDCTLGDGGHSLAILRLGGNVLGIDVDPEAIKRTRERLKSLGYLGNLVLIQGNFRDIKNLIQQTELRQKFDGAKLHLSGAIFDLGVSSLQLESPERGFSFASSGPLDMRMDPTLAVSALDLLKAFTRKELYELFFSLGEEKYSKRLADTLVRAREVAPITNTLELAEIVERAVGGRREKIHPATRIFQALRIAVNDELDALREGLEEVKDLIEKNGHIVVISFHSLEDRIVKNTFKQWKLSGIGEVLTRKPVTASQVEVRINPRSRSAKMRVFKKL